MGMRRGTPPRRALFLWMLAGCFLGALYSSSMQFQQVASQEQVHNVNPWPVQPRRTLAQTYTGNETSPFLSWMTEELGSVVGSVASCFAAEPAGSTNSTAMRAAPCTPEAVSTQPSPACLQCLYGNTSTSAASMLAAVIGNSLVQDTEALIDVCARQPKPQAILHLFTRGTAWWTPIMLSLLGERAPFHKQLDIQVWLGPVPTGPNDVYTVCGEYGSATSTPTPNSNTPLVKGLNGVTLKALGGLQEAASAPLMGSYPLLDPSAYWENKELGRMNNASGNPFGLIWPRAQLLLAYRADWFEQLGVMAPTTWDEMIQLAHALSSLPGFHNTLYSTAGRATSDEQGPGLNIQWPGHNVADWPAPGSTPTEAELTREGPILNNTALSKRWPLCLDLAPNCKGGDLLAAIAATMLQANGTAQNPYLDPVTLAPLTNGTGAAGWAAALRIHRDLALLASPDLPGLHGVAFSSCAGFSRAFAQGACAMTVEWDGAAPFLYANAGTPEPVGIGRPQDVPGNVGWAPLPGSPVMVDRATGQLMACTPGLCPHSHREHVQQYTAGTPTSGASVDVRSDTSHTNNVAQSEDGISVAPYPLLNSASLQDAGFTVQAAIQQVNRAPFSAQGFTIFAQTCTARPQTGDEVLSTKIAVDTGIAPLFGVREVLSGALQAAYAAAKTSGYFLSPYFPAIPQPPPMDGSTGASTDGSSSPATPVSQPSGSSSPGRKLQQGSTAAAVPPPPSSPTPQSGGIDVPPVLPPLEAYVLTWAAPVLQGQNTSMRPDDSRRLLAATWRARFQYTNQAAQVVLPIEVGPYFRTAYEEGLGYWYAVPGATTTTTLRRLSQRLSALVAVSPGATRAVLYASTGYVAPPDTGGGGQQAVPGVEGGSKVNLGAAIGTPLVVAAALIAVAVAALVHARRSHNRTLLGAVRPPKGAPGTTIVITDIQDSTHIWEALAADVADEAVALHHTTIRRLAAEHGGYEYATEGDSFLLAFHKASDAAQFCASLQLELLAVDWPQELLEYGPCCTVLVTPAMPIAPDHTSRNNQGDRSRGLSLNQGGTTSQLDDDYFGRDRGHTSGGVLAAGFRMASRLVSMDSAGRERDGGSMSQEGWFQSRRTFSRSSDRDTNGPQRGPRPSQPGLELPGLDAANPQQPTVTSGQQDVDGARSSSHCRNSQNSGSWLQKLTLSMKQRSARGHSLTLPNLGSPDVEAGPQMEKHSYPGTLSATTPNGRELLSSATFRRASRATSGAQVNITLDAEAQAAPIPLSALLNGRLDTLAPPIPVFPSSPPSGPPPGSYCPMTQGGIAGFPLPSLGTTPNVLTSNSSLSSRQLASSRNPLSAPQYMVDVVPEECALAEAGGVPAVARESGQPEGDSMGEGVTSGSTDRGSPPTGFGAGCLSGKWWAGASGVRASTVGEQLAALFPSMTPWLQSDLQARAEYSQVGNSSAAQLSPTVYAQREASGHISLPSIAQYIPCNSDAAPSRPSGEKVVIFRGLRVRVGCASVTHDLGVEISQNAAAGRMRYGGPCVLVAKAVQDAAQGGMVLLSASTFAQLAAEVLPPKVLVMHMGEHALGQVHANAQALYQLIPQVLLQRTPHLGPIRSERVASLGCLQSPCNEATVCFMHAVGVASLEATDNALAMKAVAVYHATAQACLLDAGGYLLEAADGLVLAAFTRPARAVRWALDTVAACMSADWPEDLLLHELGEAVTLTLAVPHNQGHEGLSEPDHLVSGRASFISHASNPNGCASLSNSHQMTNTPVGDPMDARASITFDGQPVLAQGTHRQSLTAAAGRLGRRLARLQSARIQQLLFRGLRIKCGIDFGPVRTDVVVATGRVGMRGKVMNRASRVAGVAKSGQVVTTLHTWDTAFAEMAAPDMFLGAEPPPSEREVVGSPLGLHRLKGLAEELELIQCLYPSAMNTTNMVSPFAVGGALGGAVQQHPCEVGTLR